MKTNDKKSYDNQKAIIDGGWRIVQNNVVIRMVVAMMIMLIVMFVMVMAMFVAGRIMMPKEYYPWSSIIFL